MPSKRNVVAETSTVFVVPAPLPAVSTALRSPGPFDRFLSLGTPARRRAPTRLGVACDVEVVTPTTRWRVAAGRPSSRLRSRHVLRVRPGGPGHTVVEHRTSVIAPLPVRMTTARGRDWHAWHRALDAHLVTYTGWRIAASLRVADGGAPATTATPRGDDVAAGPARALSATLASPA